MKSDLKINPAHILLLAAKKLVFLTCFALFALAFFFCKVSLVDFVCNTHLNEHLSPRCGFNLCRCPRTFAAGTFYFWSNFLFPALKYFKKNKKKQTCFGWPWLNRHPHSFPKTFKQVSDVIVWYFETDRNWKKPRDWGK